MSDDTPTPLIPHAPSSVAETSQVLRLQDVLAGMITTIGERLFEAMLTRATDGARDGELVRRFSAVCAHAASRGLEGQAVYSSGLQAILTDQAVELREVLQLEADRLRCSVGGAFVCPVCHALSSTGGRYCAHCGALLGVIQ